MSSLFLCLCNIVQQVIQHLTTGGEGDAGSNTAMVEALREHSVLVSEELKIIEDLKVLLKRQNSLKPVFGPLMREDNGHRRLAMDIRKLVMAANFDYASLTALWGEVCVTKSGVGYT